MEGTVSDKAPLVPHGTGAYNYGAVPDTAPLNPHGIPGETPNVYGTGNFYDNPAPNPSAYYNAADPSVNGDGYYQLPPHSDDHPPPVNPAYPSSLHSLPPSQYSQAPPAPLYQQQMTSNNVVVINQPQAQQVITEVRMPRASTFLMLTAVLMILCFLHGDWITFVCLIPAIICSCVAEDHNNARRYQEAKGCGNASLFCNLCSLIYFAVVVMAALAIVISVFAIGSAVVVGVVQPRCYDIYDVNGILIVECY